LAQQPPPQAPQLPRPVFETGTELVLVDVTVVDNDNRPVKNLRLEEFDLQVNGQARPIASVQYISNDAPTTGRLMLYVIDDGHMRLGASTTIVRTAEMLMAQLAPGDLVGLARMPSGQGGVEFTTDRQRIREALKRIPGMSEPGVNRNLRISEAWALETNDTITWNEAVDRECAGMDAMARITCAEALEADARVLLSEASARAQATIRYLETMFQRLATLRQPVSLIMISEGLFVARQPAAMSELARRAAEARVTLHIVRPQNNMFSDASVSGLGASSQARSWEDNLMRDGLDQLAGQTRGRLVQISAGTGAGIFERLSQELSGYYLVGFEPTAADRSGRERRIRVRTKRGGLTVRARPTFAIPSVTASASAEVARKPEAVIKDLLMAPLPERGLPMRVTAYSTSDPKDPRVRMVIAAEIGDPAEEPADWNVGVIILDDDDKVAASNAGVMKLSPASARRPAPRLLQTTVLLEPGEYTLRLAAVDGEGRAGSVHHTLHAKLAELAGKREVADLLVASEPEPKQPPRLNASGLVDTENVSMQIDVSGLDSSAMSQTRVSVQVAESATGPPLAQANMETIRRLGSVHTFGTTMRLGLLPPGEYVARAIVTGGPKGEVRAVRAFNLAPVAARPAAATTEPDPALPVDPIAAPEDAFIPPPPPRINVSIPAFDPAGVLKPEVVNAFLDELEDAHPGSPAVSAVIRKARDGKYEAPDPGKNIPAEDELSFAFVRGLAAMQQQKFAQAQAWFQVALKQASDLLAAAFYIGASHAASGRDREAVGAWQIALLSAAADNVYPVLVDALLRLGDGLQALAFIDEAPGAWEDTDARDERQATAEAMTGSYVPALERLNQVIERKPDDRRLLYLALQVMYRMRQEIGPLNDENRARFADYAARYAKAGGQNAALVTSWQKFIEKR
jgi:VWFA-related protein